MFTNFLLVYIFYAKPTLACFGVEHLYIKLCICLYLSRNLGGAARMPKMSSFLFKPKIYTKKCSFCGLEYASSLQKCFLVNLNESWFCLALLLVSVRYHANRKYNFHVCTTTLGINGVCCQIFYFLEINFSPMEIL